jgi:hypothetical protein
MSKITLRLDTLQVESFETVPGSGSAPAAWTEWECGTYGQANCHPLTGHVLNYTCGGDPSCQYYECDS